MFWGLAPIQTRNRGKLLGRGKASLCTTQYHPTAQCWLPSPCCPVTWPRSLLKAFSELTCRAWLTVQISDSWLALAWFSLLPWSFTPSSAQVSLLSYLTPGSLPYTLGTFLALVHYFRGPSVSMSLTLRIPSVPSGCLPPEPCSSVYPHTLTYM